MRAALLLLVLAGCPRTSDGVCDEDIECESGQVCARGDHLCVEPNQVKTTRTQWTINGQPASGNNCQGRTLYIQFLSSIGNDDFGFSPVPCETGQFTVDKLPNRYRAVEVGFEGAGDFDSASFDAEGTALLDLAL
jgi:hypothetical protein